MKGIGIDLVEIIQVQNASKKFIERILSEEEITIYENISLDNKKLEYLASRFAVKEALFKAHKIGDKKLNYRDISVLNDEYGAPYICIKSIKQNTQVSLSHTKNYAVAVVLIEE